MTNIWGEIQGTLLHYNKGVGKQSNNALLATDSLILLCRMQVYIPIAMQVGQCSYSSHLYIGKIWTLIYKVNAFLDTKMW